VVGVVRVRKCTPISSCRGGGGEDEALAAGEQLANPLLAVLRVDQPSSRSGSRSQARGDSSSVQAFAISARRTKRRRSAGGMLGKQSPTLTSALARSRFGTRAARLPTHQPSALGDRQRQRGEQPQGEQYEGVVHYPNPGWRAL